MSDRPVGSGMFLFLIFLIVGYCLFLFYGNGEFRTCDAKKYPNQVFCMEAKP